ncbi:MAG: hypothetical protein EPO32_07570 [Anaerolineae bacterium]|nr:MAG: hypothetical protein EPO32_07570 [Anaerolineae bacterium]
MNNLIPERSPRRLYRFFDWLRATSGGGWLGGLGIFLALWLIPQILRWLIGAQPVGEFALFNAVPAIFITLNLVVWLWMDRLAETALTDFGRMEGLPAERARALLTDFISLGPRLTRITLLFAGLAALVFALQVAPLNGISAPPSLDFIIFLLFTLLTNTFWFLAVTRMARQIFRINHLFAEVKDVNLFNLWPIYALSRYGANLGMIFIGAASVVASLFLLGTEPSSFLRPFATFVIMNSLAAALIIFLTPLVGINRRLRREKENVLHRLGDEMKLLFDETEAAIKAREAGRIGEFRTASSALREQMEAVQKIPTWPWNPGTLRNLFLPILLPLLIAILQRYVLTALGF